MSVLPLDQQEVSEKHFFVMYRHIKRTKKTSKFIRMVALDQLLIKVNDWCKKSKYSNMKKKLELLNIKIKPFDLEK